MDCEKIELQKNPEDDTCWLSRMFFCFVVPVFCRGYKRQLETSDLRRCLHSDDGKTLADSLDSAWNSEVRLAEQAGRKPLLRSAFRRVFGGRVAVCGVLLLLEEMSNLLQPIFMGGLIRYFRADRPLSTQSAYICAAGVSLCAALFTIIHHPYFYNMQRIGMQLRIAASGLIYRKALRLNTGALHKTTVGHVVNLLSNDVARFDYAVVFFHYLWVAPLMLVAYTALLWRELGVSCLAGFGAIILLAPIQGFFGRQTGKCRRQAAVKADKRIAIMSEILQAIRVVKMYAWEAAFAQLVDKARREELKVVRRGTTWSSLISGSYWATGNVIIFFALLAFLLTGNEVTAEKVFVSAALYNFARLPITLFLPFAIQFFIEGSVTLRRVQDFLTLSEYAPQRPAITPTVTLNGAEKVLLHDDSGVTLASVTASWDPEQSQPTISDISLEAKPSKLVAVVGPVGAGKSALLATILGETFVKSGIVRCEGSVAFVSQEAWIFSSSVRQNIIFGMAFDSDKYQDVIRVCALKKDIEALPEGDQTLVGDRGVVLSGGQRARVNLARAVYRDADVYLLDDPLSAVDAAVGRFIFDKCIVGRLRDKARVLVTHQLQYLGRADHVLVVREGAVVARGSLAQLQQLGDTFTAVMHEVEQSYSSRHESAPSAGGQGASSPAKRRANTLEGAESEALLEPADAERPLDRSLSESVWEMQLGDVEQTNTLPEDRFVGAVTWRIYWAFVRAMAAPCCLVLLVCFFAFVQMWYNMADWWLKVWTTEIETKRLLANESAALSDGLANGTSDGSSLVAPTSSLDYLWVYALLVAALIGLSISRVLWFRLSMIAASRRLHWRMFQAVVRAPVAFFDQNPVGRILNRFSKDTGAMDEALSWAFFDFVQGAFHFAGVVIVIGILNPVVFLPSAPIVLLFFLLRYFYLQTSRDLKRLEAVARSPVFSHISATLNGLPTIRAFGAQTAVLDNFYGFLNTHTAAFSLSLSTTRWFALMIDWLVTLYVAVVAFAAVFTGADAGAVGLSLFYSLGLTRRFGKFVDQWARVENEMVSVERIVEYGRLESEAPLESTPDRRPPDDWPAKGKMHFRNLSLKYGDDGDYALRQIDCTVNAKEKVGIVGRTGAGKSSLLRALFRLTEPEGALLIDDVDISTIGLHDLRQRIAIIPQDPLLFLGSLRKNLDPFGEFPEADIWTALAAVELKGTVTGMEGGLDAEVSEGGANLSAGQRQLVCLARALLKHSRVLVIDEATANVDVHTDALIQQTLRDKFVESTILTIAHRLHTVIDCDRVMVLDRGRLIEFDSPRNLLDNEDSAFSALVRETSASEAARLRQMAQ